MAKPLIMVVDDEVEVADAIAQQIKDTNKYEVITAYSAKEALKQLAKNKILFGLGGNRIKLIILDIKMPEMDGLQLLSEIRKNYGDQVGVSILTAWEDKEKWEKAAEGFVINYLKKPYKKEDLLDTINRFFSGEEAKQQIETIERHFEKQKIFKQQEENKP
ncbi:MAG: response regulator [Candidatus Margulisiibacteriota bacterium]